MTRSELISALAEKQPQLFPRDVELAVNCILTMMLEELEKGGRIEIRDFGGFSIRSRSARIVRNPKTGETFSQPAKVAIHFKPGKGMRERVNAARGQCTIKPLPAS